VKTLLFLGSAFLLLNASLLFLDFPLTLLLLKALFLELLLDALFFLEFLYNRIWLKTFAKEYYE
jgi:hypothetical protein